MCLIDRLQKRQKIKMASLMESYEQQYSNLTAEITCKTGQIPNLSGSMYYMYTVTP